MEPDLVSLDPQALEWFRDAVNLEKEGKMDEAVLFYRRAMRREPRLEAMSGDFDLSRRPPTPPLPPPHPDPSDGSTILPTKATGIPNDALGTIL